MPPFAHVGLGQRVRCHEEGRIQRTYELTNSGVRSSEEVHVECMVFGAVSHMIANMLEEFHRQPEACLTRCFAALLAALLTNNPLQCLALVELLSNSHTDLWNALLIYGLNRLWPRGVHKKLGKSLLAMSRSIHPVQVI